MKWQVSFAIFSLSHQHLRSLVRSCTRRKSLAAGVKLHAVLTTAGQLASPETFLRNALIHFYAATGSHVHARQLFDEIPSSYKDTADWTALMVCLASHGVPQDGLRLFAEMRKNGVRVDDVALVCVSNACAQLRDAEFGAQVHALVEKGGFGCGVMACNAVMDMYVKCGMLGDARRVFWCMTCRSVVSWTVILDGSVSLEGVGSGRAVFDAMPDRNEVAWTIMAVGYVGAGFSYEGFRLLSEMVFGRGFRLNHVTLCSVLSASAQSGDLMMGKWIHVYAMKTMGEKIHIMVETALIDMYSKCGRVTTAMKVFEQMPSRNVVAWNAMLSGLAMHGRGRMVLELFLRMIKEVKPDELTFTSLLSACSHSGLVEEGRDYFHCIESWYGITPKIEHYACMVDLLGRAGHLEEAAGLITKMPMPPNEVVLGSLLGACSIHGKIELGDRVLKELVQLNPHNTEYHVLLSNMYAVRGKHERADSIRGVLKNRGIRKVPGMSSIHVGGLVHQFSAGDKSHPRATEVYAMLDQLIRRLRLAGYVPDTNCQVFSGSNAGENSTAELEEIEQALFSHSEKLAVCFGLISTRPGSPLYIFKNLRICLDCHSAMKIVSAVYSREIIVRDRSRFHSFKHGSCSCSDYW